MLEALLDRVKPFQYYREQEVFQAIFIIKKHQVKEKIVNRLHEKKKSFFFQTLITPPSSPKNTQTRNFSTSSHIVKNIKYTPLSRSLIQNGRYFNDRDRL